MAGVEKLLLKRSCRLRVMANPIPKCCFRSQLAPSSFIFHQPSKFVHHHRQQLYHTVSSPTVLPFSHSESALLSAGLHFVPKHGFTRTALELGTQDAGYLPASAAMFPHGPFDLVHFHLITQRLALRHNIQFPQLKESDHLGLSGRIKGLILNRLRGNEALIHHWQEALALSAHPSHIQTMLSELFHLSDEIWHLAGDKVVDFSWYTRRGSLAAIYASAELFQTLDTSHNFRDTEAFVDRRLKEIEDLSGMLAAMSEWAAFSARGIVNVARSKGIKI